MPDKVKNANEVCEFCHKPTKNVVKVHVVYFRVCPDCCSKRKRDMVASASRLSKGYNGY